MTTKNKSEKESKVWRLRIPKISLLLFLVTLMLVLLVGAATTYAVYYLNRFLPHTQVNGVSLSGLTRSEGENALKTVEEEFLNRSIELVGKEKRFRITPKDLGVVFSTETTLNALWDLQQSGTILHQIKEMVLAPFQTTSVSESLTAFTGNSKEIFTKNVLSEVEAPYREVGLKVIPGKVEIVPGEAGERVDLSALEDKLLALYLHGGHEIALYFVSFSPELTVEQAIEARDRATQLTKSGWTIKLGQASVVTLTPDQMAKLIGVAVSSNGSFRGLALSGSDTEINSLVNTWAMGINRAATNARLGLAGSAVVVVAEGQSGRSMNQAEVAKQLKVQIETAAIPDSRTIAVTLDEIAPPVSAETLGALGLTQRIGVATTDFSGSPTNRRGNITLGAKLLDRKLVLAGESFSTIGTLGSITTEAGFLNELVIKGSRTIPEAGGGLCQVSTTLFRAVLNAGLPVLERQNHSYRVGYYEREVGPGLDATIYEPNPDFRWKNDFTSAVFVQSQIVGDKITFELYGTSDGRVAEIGKPVILEETPPGDSIYVNTDTLYVGEQKQIEKPKSGAKTTVSYTVTRDGKKIISTVFRSTYKNWPAQFLVGTKPKPEAAPSEAPIPTP